MLNIDRISGIETGQGSRDVFCLKGILILRARIGKESGKDGLVRLFADQTSGEFGINWRVFLLIVDETG